MEKNVDDADKKKSPNAGPAVETKGRFKVKNVRFFVAPRQPLPWASSGFVVTTTAYGSLEPI